MIHLCSSYRIDDDCYFSSETVTSQCCPFPSTGNDSCLVNDPLSWRKIKGKRCNRKNIIITVFGFDYCTPLQPALVILKLARGSQVKRHNPLMKTTGKASGGDKSRSPQCRVSLAWFCDGKVIRLKLFWFQLGMTGDKAIAVNLHGEHKSFIQNARLLPTHHTRWFLPLKPALAIYPPL